MRYAASSIVLVMLLSGCSSLSSFTGGGDFLSSSSSKGPDGVACVGSVPDTYKGLVADKNDALLAEVDEVTGEGGVCSGKVFKVAEPVRVYRVYDSSRGAVEYGRWWSLTRPAGPREMYREANAICPEWSELDRLVSCQLRAGTQVVVGTTQSAKCATKPYPKSGTLQLFVENNEWEEVLLLDNCQDEGDWPN